jgi:GT2 family glycosyltransferase
VVILSQGTRPDTLAAAIHSIQRQTVATDIVVVGNGWVPEGLPAGVHSLALPENIGIPAGRNKGVPLVAGDHLFFLDDDEALPEATVLADALALMGPTVGLLQPRIDDPTGIPSPRRWIPRLRKGDPRRSSNVFSVLEGAVLIPRPVFEKTGGWAADFFYAHEGIDLAWRVWDQHLRVWYAGELVAHHPVSEPTRHPEYFRLNARNRVWLARRNLPLILIPFYVGSWTAVQLIRAVRSAETRRGLSPWWSGWRAGWSGQVERRPMKWSTVWMMTIHGRPPVI